MHDLLELTVNGLPLLPNPFHPWCNVLLTGLHHFPRSQHSASPPLKFFHTPPLCARELGAIIIIRDTRLSTLRISSEPCMY